MASSRDKLEAATPRVAAPDFASVFYAAPRPLLLIAADPPKFTMVAVNPAHAQAFRTTPEALEGWGVFEVFPAELDEEAARFVEEIQRSFNRVLAIRAPDQMAVRRLAVTGPDGEPQERFWSATNAPVIDAAGRITHILSAIQDVTGEVEERRSEEARRLLMHEVDHRSRNTLSVVQSFVRLTSADSVEEFREVVSGRIESLARAQTSLAARRWEGARLRELLAAELAAFSPAARYSLSGPPVLLRPGHVQPMSMAAHELATNAAKYGCLSTADGRLDVSWTVEETGALHLRWVERCSRPVEPPKRAGFGTQLVRRLTRQLNGSAQFDWAPSGLIVELRFDLGG